MQDGGRIAYVPLTRGEPTWLALFPGDTANAPGLAQVTGWNDDGTKALVFAVSFDWKTRYIYTVGAKGALTALDTLRDSAWVDGPALGEAGWLDGGRRIWFVSEADGYAHLYTMAADGGDKKQLTSGKWEVDDVAALDDRRSVLSAHERGVAVRAAVLSHARHRRRAHADHAARAAGTPWSCRRTSSCSPMCTRPPIGRPSYT